MHDCQSTVENERTEGIIKYFLLPCRGEAAENTQHYKDTYPIAISSRCPQRESNINARKPLLIAAGWRVTIVAPRTALITCLKPVLARNLLPLPSPEILYVKKQQN